MPEQRVQTLARVALEAERDRALRRLAQLHHQHRGFVEASKDTNADDEHDPEGATIAFERSQVHALTRSTQEHLVEVDAALERLSTGAYGDCEACGRPISSERLAVRPTARRCVPCS